jgi:hypothetical protein
MQSLLPGVSAIGEVSQSPSMGDGGCAPYHSLGVPVQALETLLQLTRGTNVRHENIVTPFARGVILERSFKPPISPCCNQGVSTERQVWNNTFSVSSAKDHGFWGICQPYSPNDTAHDSTNLIISNMICSSRQTWKSIPSLHIIVEALVDSFYQYPLLGNESIWASLAQFPLLFDPNTAIHHV